MSIKIYWRWHNRTKGIRRVWQSNWVDGNFDVLTAAEFKDRLRGQQDMKKITFTTEELDALKALCKNQHGVFDSILVQTAQQGLALTSAIARKNKMLETEGRLHKSWKTLREIERKLGV